MLTSSTVVDKRLGGNSVYAATKAAVRALARAWMVDLKDRRIRVNTVSPGAIATPGVLNAGPGDVMQRQLDAIAAGTTLGRNGLPSEIGEVVAFLASDGASFVNGATSSSTAVGRTCEASMIFVCIARYTEDADLIAATRPVHRAYARSLRAAGRLLVAGPFADDSGAILVYEAGSADEVHDLIAHDPYRQCGVFVGAEVKQWDVIADSDVGARLAHLGRAKP